MRNLVAFLVVAMATPVFATNPQWETVGPELKRLVATTTVEVVTGLSQGNKRSGRVSVDDQIVGDIVAGTLKPALDNYRPKQNFSSYTAGFDDLRQSVMGVLTEHERGITWDEKDGKRISLNPQENNIDPVLERAFTAAKVVFARNLHLMQSHLETNYPELLTIRNVQLKIAAIMNEAIQEEYEKDVTLMGNDPESARALDLVKRENDLIQREQRLKTWQERLMQQEQNLMEREAQLQHREWIIQQKEELNRRERILTSREDRVKKREDALKEKEGDKPNRSRRHRSSTE